MRKDGGVEQERKANELSACCGCPEKQEMTTTVTRLHPLGWRTPRQLWCQLE